MAQQPAPAIEGIDGSMRCTCFGRVEVSLPLSLPLVAGFQIFFSTCSIPENLMIKLTKSKCFKQVGPNTKSQNCFKKHVNMLIRLAKTYQFPAIFPSIQSASMQFLVKPHNSSGLNSRFFIIFSDEIILNPFKSSYS